MDNAPERTQKTSHALRRRALYSVHKTRSWTVHRQKQEVDWKVETQRPDSYNPVRNIVHAQKDWQDYPAVFM